MQCVCVPACVYATRGVRTRHNWANSCDSIFKWIMRIHGINLQNDSRSVSTKKEFLSSDYMLFGSAGSHCVLHALAAHWALAVVNGNITIFENIWCVRGAAIVVAVRPNIEHGDNLLVSIRISTENCLCSRCSSFIYDDEMGPFATRTCSKTISWRHVFRRPEKRAFHIHVHIHIK